MISSGEINGNVSPVHIASVKILRNNYLDIPHPGQLIGFRGFGNYIDELKLVAMEIEISKDYFIIELGAFTPKNSQRLEDLRRNLQNLEALETPDNL